MVELTPTLLFLLLNIIIAIIFFVSSFTTPSRRPQLTRASSFLSRVTSFGPIEPIDSPQHNSDATVPLVRTPSLLSRISSFNFSGLKQAQDPSAGPPAVSASSSFSFSGLKQTQELSVGSAAVSDSSSLSFSGLKQTEKPSAGPHAVPDSSSDNFLGPKQAQEPSAGPPAMPDSSSFSFLDLNQAQQPSAGTPVMSDSPSSSMDQPNKDLTLMEHQDEKCEGESTSEVTSESNVGSEMTWFKSNKEVDAKADDFINKFKQQLKLQRLDSLLRYRYSAN